jgi:hypothetical protein
MAEQVGTVLPDQDLSQGEEHRLVTPRQQYTGNILVLLVYILANAAKEGYQFWRLQGTHKKFQ